MRQGLRIAPTSTVGLVLFSSAIAGCSGSDVESVVARRLQEERHVLVCSSEFVAPDGVAERIDDEYYPLVMNRLLREDPELREATGLDSVDDCDDARTFTRERLALAESEAATSDDDATEETADAGEDKFWEGDDVDDWSVLRIIAGGGACSAVPITPKHILTAAHCFSAGGSTTITIQRSAGPGAITSLGSFPVTVFRHENYTGVGDPGDDIALIAVNSSAWNYTSLNTLWIGSITGSTDMEGRGFGSKSQYSPTPVALNGPDHLDLFRPDWDSTFHFLDDNDGEVGLCQGDSGGPARLVTGTHPVAGLASEAEMASGRICRTTDGSKKQRWTRISGHISWIEARLPFQAGYTCPASGPCCVRNGSEVRCF